MNENKNLLILNQFINIQTAYIINKNLFEKM